MLFLLDATLSNALVEDILGTWRVLLKTRCFLAVLEGSVTKLFDRRC